MFKNMGGNIPGGNLLGGNFSGGNLMGGNLPGGSFPDTVQNTSRRLLLWTTAFETLNTKYLELIKEDQKSKKKICHVNAL